MADIAIDNPPTESRKRPSSGSAILPPLILFGAMFMAADFTAIELRPLRALQIPYPKAMDYSHFLIPAGCATLWLVSRRRWPNASGFVAVLLCFTLVGVIPIYAQSRVAKLNVTRRVESSDLASMEARLGVPVYWQGSAEGTVVMVAPQNEQRVGAELARLQLLGEPGEE